MKLYISQLLAPIQVTQNFMMIQVVSQVSHHNSSQNFPGFSRPRRSEKGQYHARIIKRRIQISRSRRSRMSLIASRQDEVELRDGQAMSHMARPSPHGIFGTGKFISLQLAPPTTDSANNKETPSTHNRPWCQLTSAQITSPMPNTILQGETKWEGSARSAKLQATVSC